MGLVDGVDSSVPPDGWSWSHVDRVRFGDLDAMRHLNNVEFLRFFESARIAYLGTIMPTHNPTEPDDFGLIFAECHINYRSPGHFDEEIRTWVRLGEVRRSAFRVEFRMEASPDRRLLAEGWGTLVGYDYAGERATPLPDGLRERLVSAGGARAEAETS